MATNPVTRDKRLKRFERLVRAYRVRLENGQWIVKKLAGKSRIFSAKGEAIEVAKEKSCLRARWSLSLLRRACLAKSPTKIKLRD